LKKINLDWFSRAGAVRLKVGGPLMTVVDFDENYPLEDGSRGGFFCTWVDGMFLHEDVFSPLALELVTDGQNHLGWEYGI